VTSDIVGIVQVSNSATVYDLQGQFNNVSVNGGTGVAASVDMCTGNSPNGPVNGGRDDFWFWGWSIGLSDRYLDPSMRKWGLRRK